MTDEQFIDLGRRAVACKGWRWLPGMSIIRRKTGPAGGTGLRPTHLRVALTCGHPCDPFASVVDVDRLPRPCPPDPHWVPDLRDPATVGCLLALVRGEWGDLGASTWHDRRTGLWSWMAGGCIHSVWRPSDADGYPNEAAAIVAALEAANGA